MRGASPDSRRLGGTVGASADAQRAASPDDHQRVRDARVTRGILHQRRYNPAASYTRHSYQELYMTSRKGTHPRPALRARPDRRGHRAAGREPQRLPRRRRRRRRSRQGRSRSRRDRRRRAIAAREGSRTIARKAIKASKPGRRRALHAVVAEEGDAADRGDSQAQGADRLDDRGAGVSVRRQPAATRARSTGWRRRRRSRCSAPA